jgi:hypothetical protein
MLDRVGAWVSATLRLGPELLYSYTVILYTSYVYAFQHPYFKSQRQTSEFLACRPQTTSSDAIGYNASTLILTVRVGHHLEMNVAMNAQLADSRVTPK